MSRRRGALLKARSAELVDGVGDLRGGVGEVNRSVELLEDARIIESVAQCDELRMLRGDGGRHARGVGPVRRGLMMRYPQR